MFAIQRHRLRGYEPVDQQLARVPDLAWTIRPDPLLELTLMLKQVDKLLAIMQDLSVATKQQVHT